MEIQRQSECFAYRIAAPNSQKLYRGVTVFPDTVLADRIAELYEQGKLDPEKHQEIGPLLLEHFTKTYGGLGSHWTTDPRLANDWFDFGDSFTDQPVEPPKDEYGQDISGQWSQGWPGHSPFLAVIEADWDGTGEAEVQEGIRGPGGGENEITLTPGAPVTVTNVRIPGFKFDKFYRKPKIETLSSPILHHAQNEPRILYHLTDNPDFQLDPEFEPEAALTIPAIRNTGPGIWLTSDPDYWVREHQYWRPYVAEIEVPEPIWGRDQYEKEYGNYGPESFVPAHMFDKLKVRGVKPYNRPPPPPRRKRRR